MPTGGAVVEQKVVSRRKLRGYLRNLELFEMLPDDDLKKLISEGTLEGLGSGKLLFDAGDPGDRIHVILEGALEIIRATPDHPERVPVAYLSPGEIIGDMALLTGTLRRSGGRVPEKLAVWTLTRKAFENFAGEMPGYWRAIAKVFARRHETFITHVRQEKRRKELSGRLEFFDLPTVVQTLVSANQTGVLTVVDDHGDTFAEVVLVNGAVERARSGMLEGEDAFYEIFLAGIQGQFFFRTMANPNPDSISETAISRGTITLLMEALRLVDELPAVRNRLPDPDKAYVSQTDEVEWSEEDTAEAATLIFNHLRTPMKLERLTGKVPCSTFTLHEIAATLFQTDQIA
jgi:CRP-like cAMP-binding protein